MARSHQNKRRKRRITRRNRRGAAERLLRKALLHFAPRIDDSFYRPLPISRLLAEAAGQPLPPDPPRPPWPRGRGWRPRKRSPEFKRLARAKETEVVPVGRSL